MDTIKIIKGVFNNEDIIKDNNAIAAAFADGTFIGIDTKNDDKFQKDFLSGSGNKDEKDIYISTIDMLTPEADVQVNSSGGKQLRVKGVRCKNISHSDSSKRIPAEAVATLSNMSKYTDLALQMPDSASWNFNSSGTATTDVTFTAKGKSGSVKSTTKHGKFVVTQNIKVSHYTEADGLLPAQSTVYRKGNSTFEGAVIQQAKRFQAGKQTSPCAEVTQATLDSYGVSSLTDARNVSNTAKWLSISCGAHWSLVVAKNESSLLNTTSVIMQTYTTSEDDIDAGAAIYIGFYEQEFTKNNETVYYPGGEDGLVDASKYGNHNYETADGKHSGRIDENGKPRNSNNGYFNLSGNIIVKDVITYKNSYKKKHATSYTPDNNLFYAGLYCRNSGWYDASGGDANKDTPGVIYSVRPTAGSGFKFDSEDMFYVKEATEESVVANDALCTVNNTGDVTLKKDADLEDKLSYSRDGVTSFSVSFD